MRERQLVNMEHYIGSAVVRLKAVTEELKRLDIRTTADLGGAQGQVVRQHRSCRRGRPSAIGSYGRGAHLWTELG